MAGRGLSASRRASALAAAFAAAVALAEPAAPPASYADRHVDRFHGVELADPYRWLEDTRAPWTRAWFEAQNGHARAILDALPGRRPLRDEVARLMSSAPVVVEARFGGERLFTLEREAGAPLFRLVVRNGVDGAPRVVVDPARYATEAGPASIDYFAPSPNGRYAAVAVSSGGSEAATLRVIDVDSGRELGGAITRADFGALAWRFDSAALYYLRHREPPADATPADRYKDASVWMREIALEGSGPPDVPVFGRSVGAGVDIAPDDTPTLLVSPVSSYALGVVHHGVAREISVFVAPLTALKGPSTPWRKVIDRAQGVEEVALRGEWLYARTHDGAPRYRLVRHSLKNGTAFVPEAAEAVLGETDAILATFGIAKDAIYVVHHDAGIGRVDRLEFNVKLVPVRRVARAPKGKTPPAALPKVAGVARASSVALPFTGAVQELVTDPLRGGALVRLAGWTEPPGYFAVAPKTAAVTRTPVQPRSPVDFGGASATQTRVGARDGARVPLTIIAARGFVRDGRAPVIVEAYGAYGVSLEPAFRPALRAWLARGGLYAIAHVRGGGEGGKPWHAAGQHANKPTSARDLADCVGWLVANRYASADRVVLRGASAGAIAVVGAALEAPALARAFVSEVGFHDAARGEFAATGPANAEEFGSVATPEGLRALLAMSPYANARDGVAYPAGLFTAGYNDPRVEPWDPGKMAARLQAIAQAPGGGGRPVLLVTDFASGHGGTTLDQRIDETTDLLAFALWQVGATGFALP